MAVAKKKPVRKKKVSVASCSGAGRTLKTHKMKAVRSVAGKKLASCKKKCASCKKK